MNETNEQRENLVMPDAVDVHADAAPDAENQQADADADALRTELDELRRELDQAREQLLRKAAEFQNYRRRTEEEKRVLVEIGKGSVVEQLLDVVDDLARTVDASKEETATLETISRGAELVYDKLMTELKKIGVEPIEAVGTPFDENLHEALMRQPVTDGTAPGTVVQEIRRGYRMDDRVLRHARVVVAAESD